MTSYTTNFGPYLETLSIDYDEEESAGPEQRGGWGELEKHRKILSESVDKSGYVKAFVVC